jgi:anti-sigma B factor antagonist
MPTPSAKLSVLVAGRCAFMKIAGRANFTFSPDFKAFLTGLGEKGYRHFTIDLSECVLMDSTFLGVLAGFGLATNPRCEPDKRQIELLNPNARITELLENLGVLHLFRVATGQTPPPAGARPATSEPVNPTSEQITRTCLEAHQTLMAANPDNVARFKDVAQFLAEDLKNLQNLKYDK